MTPEQNDVKQWMKAFGQETPEKPVVPNLETRKLRAKLILEEALETIGALGIGLTLRLPVGDGPITPDSPVCVEVFSPKYFSELISANEEMGGIYKPNLEEIADGCEDLKVVVEGTLVACGLVKQGNLDKHTNNDPLFDEVMRSNWSKFWTAEDAQKFNSEYPDNQNTFVQRRTEGRLLCKDKDGKVIKSPSYSSPNLQPIIDEMSQS